MLYRQPITKSYLPFKSFLLKKNKPTKNYRFDLEKKNLLIGKAEKNYNVFFPFAGFVVAEFQKKRI